MTISYVMTRDALLIGEPDHLCKEHFEAASGVKVKGGASQTYVVDTMKMKKTTTVSVSEW